MTFFYGLFVSILIFYLFLSLLNIHDQNILGLNYKKIEKADIMSQYFSIMK